MFFFLDKKVFPKYDILGWYSTGSDIQETDMQIHKTVQFFLYLNGSFCFFSMQEHSDCLLYIIMDIICIFALLFPQPVRFLLTSLFYGLVSVMQI